MSTRFRIRSLAMLAVAGSALLSPARDARAALVLAAEVRDAANVVIASVIAYDDDVVTFPIPAGYVQISDTTAGLGILTLANQNVGGLFVTGSTHTSTFATTLGTNNVITSGSSTVSNISGSTRSVELIVGDTSFVGPSVQVETTGSGTFTNATGSSIEMGWFNDPANGQAGDPNGVDSVPGNLVDTFSFTALDASESFSHNGGPFVANDPSQFSMTLQSQFTLTAGGQLTSRGQSELKPLVPEPATLAMVATALPLLGIGYLRRRRRQAEA